MKATFCILFYVFHLFYNPIDSGATQLDASSIDEALKNHELVLINFYADWCRFSNMLAPIWDEAADLVQEKLGHLETKVMVAKVDCDREEDLCHNHEQDSLGQKFHITKYPTLKYVRNGQVANKEYRGQRSKESILEFIQNELRDPVKEIGSLEELKDMDNKKRHIIGYFDDRSSSDYTNFKKVSQRLKDHCLFFAGFGEVVKHMHPPGQNIVAYRPNYATSNENDQTFTGSLQNHEEFDKWTEGMCIPLVREITFENAEELTEEGLPFLILFHHPDDTQSVKDFNEVVKTQLLGDKGNVNFLIADGLKFEHPLHHLGKSSSDLPLIVIDSFRHMYLFKEYKDMHTPGKLKKFLEDLYSGKLHREYHYGPDQTEENQEESSDAGQGSDDSETQDGIYSAPPPPEPTKTKPPPSQFQHLQPSKNRYTLLRDEF